MLLHEVNILIFSNFSFRNYNWIIEEFSSLNSLRLLAWRRNPLQLSSSKLTCTKYSTLKTHMPKPFHARSCALSHMLYHSQDSCGLSSFQKHIHIWCPLKLFKNLESKKIVSMCQQLNICTIRQIQNHENYWYYLVFMQPQYIHNQSLCAPIIEQKMWYLCSNTSFLTIFDRTSSR